MSDPLEELARQQQSRRVANVRPQGMRPPQSRSPSPQPRSSNKTLYIVLGVLVTIVIVVAIFAALVGFGIWKAKEAVTEIKKETGLTEFINKTGLTDSGVLSSNKEARRQAEECLSQHWTKTGNFWTSIESELEQFSSRYTGSKFIRQVSGLTFDVTEFPLNEADRLNNIEFKGRVDYSAKATRILKEDHKWRTWAADANNPIHIGSIELKKIKGKWEVELTPSMERY